MSLLPVPRSIYERAVLFDMIAVPDGEGSCTYKHKKHCTPDEMESRLTIGEVKRQHEQLNRENMRHNN